MDREAFPDDIPDQPVGHEDNVADLVMPEEDDEDAMVTALLLAGVESDVVKMYAAQVVGSAKAETFCEVYGRDAIVQEAIKSRVISASRVCTLWTCARKEAMGPLGISQSPGTGRMPSECKRKRNPGG